MDALIRDFVSQANDYDGGLTREGQEIAHCLLSAACDPDSIRRREVLVGLGHKLDGILDLSDEVSDDGILQDSEDKFGVMERGTEWVDYVDNLVWQAVTGNYDPQWWSPRHLLGFAASMSGSVMAMVCICDGLDCTHTHLRVVKHIHKRA
jgi:hypothetical protein